MPYLNRRTVRSLLARSRPPPTPTVPKPSSPDTCTTAEQVEQVPSLPSSASAPVELARTTTSSSPVTAHEDQSSPATTRSLPHESGTPERTIPPCAATFIPPCAPAQETSPAQNGASGGEYIDAGIPLASTPEESARDNSPPFQFESLFAVPTALGIQSPTASGPPPTYQPHASEGEVFPQLEFTPFHRNAMAARATNTIEHDLPGDDRFPQCSGTRVVNGSWLGGRFEPFTVGGRTFFCPVHLLLRYPHWRLLLHLERPPQGWVLSPSLDASIFALVLEALLSPSGFHGTEPGLNLVRLALATSQALEWGMHREVDKLVATFRRYVARRLLFRNPHRPDASGAMDHNYFVYRSEEIFRAWRVLSRGSRELQGRLPPAEMVCLYGLAVPRDLWPALTAEFPDEFAGLIDFSARVRVVPEEVDFQDWWLRFFRLAGCLDLDWMGDVPSVLDMFLRGHDGLPTVGTDGNDAEGNAEPEANQTGQ